MVWCMGLICWTLSLMLCPICICASCPHKSICFIIFGDMCVLVAYNYFFAHITMCVCRVMASNYWSDPWICGLWQIYCLLLVIDLDVFVLPSYQNFCVIIYDIWLHWTGFYKIDTLCHSTYIDANSLLFWSINIFPFCLWFP